jgi:Zn-dependent protease
MGQHKVLDLVNFMAILIVSTACHESAHARLAVRFGDETPREHGRISWNPFVHLHPIYTLLLPAVFYWQTGSYFAGAFTPVNPSRMRNPRLHSLLVALGGPATNFLLALLFFGVLSGYVISIGGLGHGTADHQRNLLGVLVMAVQMNLFLGIFNFLPVPPLDGSDIIAFFLPPRLRVRWIEFRRHAWILFVILMVTGVLDAVLGPAMKAADGVVWSAFERVNEYARRG